MLSGLIISGFKDGIILILLSPRAVSTTQRLSPPSATHPPTEETANKADGGAVSHGPVACE